MSHRALLLMAVGATRFIGAPSPSPAQTMRTFSVTRPVGSERFLHVTLDFSGGAAVIFPAADGELYALKLRYDADRSEPEQEYDPRTGLLHIGVASVGAMGVRVTSEAQLAQTARFEFSSTTPLALDASFSSSDVTIDLGGLMLTDLKFRATATHAAVDFSRPTRGACRSATFTVGASQIDAAHVAQSGCESLRVDGGAGSASLRFDGEWRRDMDLVVDLAVGSLTLELPRGTGVKLTGQRFLAPFDSRGLVRAGDTWTTPGYDSAPHKLTVELTASMVGIDVEWIEQR